MSSGLWVTPSTFVEFGRASTGELSRTIASRDTAYDFSSFVGLLPDPDPVLAKRGDGAEILETLTADGHLLSVIQQRKKGSQKKEYKWSPGTVDDETTPESERLCDLFTADLARLHLAPVISSILDAPYYGQTPLELLWEPGDHIRLTGIKARPARWFGYDDRNQPRFRSMEAPFDGERLPWGKFVFARHEPTYDNPYGLRLLSRCFWPVLFKKGGIKFWVTFTEKYGMPFLLGRYRQGSTTEEKNAMLTALAKMVQDAVAVIPDGNAVEMLGGTGKTGGSYLTFERLKDAMDAEVSKVIVGQTLTTDVSNKGGAYAASKTHENMLDDLRQADQTMVKTTMDEIAGVYRDLNAPGVPAPVFGWYESEDPQADFAERDRTLTETGQVRLTKSYLMRRYNFQEDDIEVIPAAPGSAPEQGQQFAEPAPARWTPEQQALEELAEAAVQGADLSANEQQLVAAVESSSTFDEVFARVLALYPRLDMAGLQEMTRRALMAAELHGRTVAQQDNPTSRQGERS